MNKATLTITLAVIVMGILFSVLAFVYFEPTTPYVSGTSAGSESTNPSATGQSQGNSSSSSSSSASTITMAQLAEHNSQSDCWVGYKGKAYDLTSFLPRHPGSAGAIAPYCGTAAEFEQAFTRQHGTSKASMFMKVAIYKGDLTQ